MKKVSVVVCTWNRYESLKKTLYALEGLRYEDYEVIVVDDGSVDDTPRLRAEFEKVKFVRQKHQGIAAARNTGTFESSAELIAYIDDDCIPDENWLKNLVEVMNNAGADIVGGNSYLSDGILQFSQYAVDKQGVVYFNTCALDDKNKLMAFNTLNMLVKKKVFNKIKFDIYFVNYFEDTDFCVRAQLAGFKIAHAPKAKITHFDKLVSRNDITDVIVKHPIYFSVKNFGLNYSFIIHTTVWLIKTTRWFFINKKKNKIILLWANVLVGIKDGLGAKIRYGCRRS